MEFLENDNKFRPLKMIHGYFGYRLWHPYFYAMLKTKIQLKKYKKMGYGGVVLNTYNGKNYKSWSKHYLTNEKTFEYLRGVLKICKKMELRVWLYDELGYPSGGAYGKIVKNYPETECYGIICNPHSLKKGESINLTLPYGHEKLKAVLFDDGSSVKDITDFANSNGSISYTADTEGTLYYIASKVLYEGVHPSRKFAPSCRYIDAMDKDAVAKFLEMTYASYIKYIGEYFGNTVEAVFTDEPSVMNQYFSKLPRKVYQIDPVDENIPFYKFVAWSRNFEEEFLSRKGYDITPNIPKLFESNGEIPCKVKQDYYEVCCTLYKEAYFDQYSAFCEKLGLKFSGHLLGEERLQDQIINELDFFEMMEPMHYPGIDLLSCNPKNLINKPLLLRTVSSAAALAGKPFVMSETSFHSDNEKDVTKEKTLCTLLIEYANGINVITSYMNKKGYSASDKRHCYDRLAKAGQLLENGDFYSELLVYYPVRSGYAFNTPSLKGHNERDYDPIFAKICDGFKEDLLNLEKSKIKYTLLNSRYMKKTAVENGSILVGKCLPFKAIYIPYCFVEVEGVEGDILRLLEGGTKIFVNAKSCLTPALEKLKENGNLYLVDSAEQIESALYADCPRDIVFEGDCQNIVYCKKIFNTVNTYMFVNASDKTASFKVKIHSTDSPLGYDVANDCEFEPEVLKSEEYSTVKLSLPPYEARFLIFGCESDK